MKQPFLLFIRVWTPECHMWWEMEGIEIPTPYAVFGKPTDLHVAVAEVALNPLS